MELLGSVLNAMQSKVALLPFFIYNSKDCSLSADTVLLARYKCLLSCLAYYLCIWLRVKLWLCLMQLVEKQPNIESDAIDHSFKKLEELYAEKV